MAFLPYRGPYGTALREGPLRGGFLREGWALTGSPLRGGTVLTGRAGVPYGSFTEKDDEEAYGKAPYGEASYEKAPYELQESLQEAMGGTLTELGGNCRLCAVDQKRPFFPRAGPFLDLLPFKGPFSLTGALTGPPYGKAPYGEASYGKAGPSQEAPYEEGRSLREGPGSRTGPSQRRTTKRLTGKLRGGTLPELGRNFRLCAVDQKKAVFS